MGCAGAYVVIFLLILVILAGLYWEGIIPDFFNILGEEEDAFATCKSELTTCFTDYCQGASVTSQDLSQCERQLKECNVLICPKSESEGFADVSSATQRVENLNNFYNCLMNDLKGLSKEDQIEKSLDCLGNIGDHPYVQAYIGKKRCDVGYENCELTGEIVNIQGSGSATGATAVITILDNVIQTITLLDAGTGYSDGDVTLEGQLSGSNDATATITVDTDGKIDTITLTDVGSSYIIPSHTQVQESLQLSEQQLITAWWAYWHALLIADRNMCTELEEAECIGNCYWNSEVQECSCACNNDADYKCDVGLTEVTNTYMDDQEIIDAVEATVTCFNNGNYSTDNAGNVEIIRQCMNSNPVGGPSHEILKAWYLIFTRTAFCLGDI